MQRDTSLRSDYARPQHHYAAGAVPSQGQDPQGVIEAGIRDVVTKLQALHTLSRGTRIAPLIKALRAQAEAVSRTLDDGPPLFDASANRGATPSTHIVPPPLLPALNTPPSSSAAPATPTNDSPLNSSRGMVSKSYQSSLNSGNEGSASARRTPTSVHPEPLAPIVGDVGTKSGPLSDRSRSRGRISDWEMQRRQREQEVEALRKAREHLQAQLRAAQEQRAERIRRAHKLMQIRQLQAKSNQKASDSPASTTGSLPALSEQPTSANEGAEGKTSLDETTTPEEVVPVTTNQTQEAIQADTPDDSATETNPAARPSESELDLIPSESVVIASADSMPSSSQPLEATSMTVTPDSEASQVAEAPRAARQSEVKPKPTISVLAMLESEPDDVVPAEAPAASDDPSKSAEEVKASAEVKVEEMDSAAPSTQESASAIPTSELQPQQQQQQPAEVAQVNQITQVTQESVPAPDPDQSNELPSAPAISSPHRRRSSLKSFMAVQAAARGLARNDWFSKSDPRIVVRAPDVTKGSDESNEPTAANDTRALAWSHFIAATETILNDQNPNFRTRLPIPYMDGAKNEYMFAVYDVDDFDDAKSATLPTYAESALLGFAVVRLDVLKQASIMKPGDHGSLPAPYSYEASTRGISLPLYDRKGQPCSQGSRLLLAIASTVPASSASSVFAVCPEPGSATSSAPSDSNLPNVPTAGEITAHPNAEEASLRESNPPANHQEGAPSNPQQVGEGETAKVPEQATNGADAGDEKKSPESETSKERRQSVTDAKPRGSTTSSPAAVKRASVSSAATSPKHAAATATPRRSVVSQGRGSVGSVGSISGGTAQSAAAAQRQSITTASPRPSRASVASSVTRSPRGSVGSQTSPRRGSTGL